MRSLRYLCVICLCLSLLSGVVAEAPEVEEILVLRAEASHTQAKTGDVVSVSIVSGTARRIPIFVTENGTDVFVSWNETFLPSPGPLQVTVARSDGSAAGIGGLFNLTGGTASIAFRVTESMGFDQLTISVYDLYANRSAMPLRVQLIFSEEQRFRMEQEALRLIRQDTDRLVLDVIQRFWFLLSVTVVVIVLFGLVAVAALLHRIARDKKMLSWADRVKLAFRWQVWWDPTKYIMDQSRTWSPHVPAKARKAMLRYDKRILRQIAGDLSAVADRMHELGIEDQEADSIIRESRERLGLPQNQERGDLVRP